jgi:ADP-heptose:LPS heptosyltransferase
MISRIQILKQLDAFIGPRALLFFRRRTSHRLPPENRERMLVIRPGGIGDAALLLPSITAVKNTEYAIQIDILCEKRNAGVFRATPYVDTIYCYDRPLDLMRLALRHYDLIIDTEQSHFLSAVFSACLKGDYRIGFKVNGRQCVYDRAVSYSQERYEAESFWDLFRCVFPIPDRMTWEPPYFVRDGSRVAPGKRGNLSELPWVCLFPGATVKERLWDSLNWSHLADYFEENGFQVALLGGRAEIDTCCNILRRTRSGRAHNFAGRLTIFGTTRLLEKSALLISTDSGILHVGVLSGVPTVSLFGSGISSKWGPKGLRHRIIHLNLACSPCTRFGTTPECQHHIGCMRIPVAKVIEASESILKGC